MGDQDFVLNMVIVLLLEKSSGSERMRSKVHQAMIFVASLLAQRNIGVVAEVTLRLIAFLRSSWAAVVQFNLIREATDTVSRSCDLDSLRCPGIFRYPTIQAVNQFKKLSLEERPTLFIEFHVQALRPERGVRGG